MGELGDSPGRGQSLRKQSGGDGSGPSWEVETSGSEGVGGPQAAR